MTISVVGPYGPMSPVHGAYTDFQKSKSDFPSVIVWVWHRKPGNMHPCNSDAQIT